jgi:hypothetical protein
MAVVALFFARGNIVLKSKFNEPKTPVIHKVWTMGTLLMFGIPLFFGILLLAALVIGVSLNYYKEWASDFNLEQYISVCDSMMVEKYGLDNFEKIMNVEEKFSVSVQYEITEAPYVAWCANDGKYPILF